MVEHILEYWYLYAVIAVLLAVCVFAVLKASKAVRRHSEAVRVEREALERLSALAEKYAHPTAESVKAAPARELCEGIAAAVEKQLARSASPDEDFQKCEAWQRAALSLYYFSEDVKTSLSFFFRNNSQSVTSQAVGFLELTPFRGIASAARKLYDMFDDENESASFDKSLIERLDLSFSSEYSEEEFFVAVKVLILTYF